MKTMHQSTPDPIDPLDKTNKRSASGGGLGTGDTYERQASFNVPEGTVAPLVESTVGGIIITGSIVGLSAELLRPVTSGTVDVVSKINGAPAISVQLSFPANPAVVSGTAISGTHPVAIDDVVTVEISTSGYINADTLPSGLAVTVAFSAASAAIIPFDSRRFIYTVSQPGDGTDFLVPLGTAMTNTNYVVNATLGDSSSFVNFRIPTANRALAAFRVITSGTLANGDTIYFTVLEI